MTDSNRLTDVAGIAVGHWEDSVALTGCTVILLPQGSTASGEIRGGAPASRDFSLLDPERTVDRIDAVLLAGGSAFGLAAAEGVMAWLESQGRGWETPAGRVPIVPSLALFDLAVGDSSVRPGPDQGRAACASASRDGHEVGLVGAGTGCTTGKWRGPDHMVRGGLVAASSRVGEVVVSTLIAVNAWGTVGGRSDNVAEVLLGQGTEQTEGEPSVDGTGVPTARSLANTTIGVVATNVSLTKSDCRLLAEAAHDGLARSVFPAHGRGDGDAFVAVSTRRHQGSGMSVDDLRMLAVATVERAVLGLKATVANPSEDPPC